MSACTDASARRTSARLPSRSPTVGERRRQATRVVTYERLCGIDPDLVLEAAHALHLRAGDLALAQLQPAREAGERVVDDHEEEADEDEDLQDRRLDHREEV